MSDKKGDLGSKVAIKIFQTLLIIATVYLPLPQIFFKVTFFRQNSILTKRPASQEALYRMQLRYANTLEICEKYHKSNQKLYFKIIVQNVVLRIWMTEQDRQLKIVPSDDTEVFLHSAAKADLSMLKGLIGI